MLACFRGHIFDFIFRVIYRSGALTVGFVLWGLLSLAPRLPAAFPPLGDYSLVDALPGITFEQPVALAHPPGETNRLFVVEREGIIHVIPDLTSPTKEVFLDLRENLFSAYGEAGLLGLVFHPGYSTNGFFYVFRTLSAITGEIHGVHNEVSRFQVDPLNPSRAVPGSETRIISQYDDRDLHNGGDLHFGPDGYLYISIGYDGPLPEEIDPNNLQPIDQGWFGCILRIDVDKRPGNLVPNPHPGITDQFLIPQDNPFVGCESYQGLPVDPAKVRTEIYALGFRNPWRMSIDSLTGEIWVGDVGSALFEEVNMRAAFTSWFRPHP